MLYIGIKDNGEIYGIQDNKKIMEGLPNKIRELHRVYFSLRQAKLVAIISPYGKRFSIESKFEE